MLSRLQQFIDRLRLDTARASLGAWLASINVAIVVLVVGGISVSAIGSLRDLADEQGAAQVQLAGAMALEDLRRFNEDALTHAKSVSDSQTFQRLAAGRRAATIEPFLRRSCNTETIAACAVFNGEELIAQAGETLPWSEIAQAAAEQGERFMAAPDPEPASTSFPASVLGASSQIGSAAELRLFVVRLLDQRMSQLLSERVGLDIRLINYRAFVEESNADALAQLHSAGLSDGRYAVARIEDGEVYAASFPVFASTGEAIALLEARLPTREIDAAVGRLIQRLLATAIVLAALAVLAGAILGQQVTGPVAALTIAAERLGRGDFSTSIPVGGTKEVGRLARTMEDMRNNLVELTGTLRHSEAEAQAVLAGIVEGVYAVDRSRTIRFLNPQAARLLGVNADEAIGKFCGDVLKPCLEDGQRPCETRCPILRARTGGSAQATERLNLPQGQLRTTVITSAAPVDELQVQVIRDETELEGVRRARDSVLANISHEFRTPLAAQLASIELLRDGLETLPRDEQRDLVSSLERGALRLTRLIDNLLESVRIESDQLSIRHQSVAISEIVEDANALIGALLAQRRQRLVLDLPATLPRIEGDGPRLTQVLVNLLANASKFAPEETAIVVGAVARDDIVELWVEDEGPGVPGIESDSIFDRFYRGPEQEPEPGGLGLGLWIVKSIIERHGGKISASRTEQGKTRFEVRLPTKHDEA